MKSHNDYKKLLLKLLKPPPPSHCLFVGHLQGVGNSMNTHTTWCNSKHWPCKYCIWDFVLLLLERIFNFLFQWCTFYFCVEHCYVHTFILSIYKYGLKGLLITITLTTGTTKDTWAAVIYWDFRVCRLWVFVHLQMRQWPLEKSFWT